MLRKKRKWEHSIIHKAQGSTAFKPAFSPVGSFTETPEYVVFVELRIRIFWAVSILA